jgi:hypothetical protein
MQGNYPRVMSKKVNRKVEALGAVPLAGQLKQGGLGRLEKKRHRAIGLLPATWMLLYFHQYRIQTTTVFQYHWGDEVREETTETLMLRG